VQKIIVPFAGENWQRLLINITEMELKRFYHTIERIQQHEAIASFLKWVRNKDPHYYDKSVKMKNMVK
jgi:hypothetical protein